MAIDLNLVQSSGIRASGGQQAVIHVFVDQQAQRIAGVDGVRADNARIQERLRETEHRLHGGCACHPAVDGHDERVAFILHGTCKDFLFAGT